MKFRYLRIAFSATCLIACVLLIVLWVRSYWRNDIVSRVDKNSMITTYGSNWGSAYRFQMKMPPGAQLEGGRSWSFHTDEASKDPARFRWESKRGKTSIAVPYWFLVVTAAFFSFAVFLTRHTRFSLRTLLIATTLV